MKNVEKKQSPLYGIPAYVDIVFCVDVTRSMAPMLNAIKHLMLDFYDDLVESMHTKYERIVQQLRVKVIAFRDYYCNGPYAMEESSFFTLPEQKNEYRNFVASLKVMDGGDEPENALEAIALAMKSDWTRVSNYNSETARNIIIVFTDAPAHPLEKSADGVSDFYPADMLKNYEELYEAWSDLAPLGSDSRLIGLDPYRMDLIAERLLVFAPEDDYPWSDILSDFIHTASVPISCVKDDALCCEMIYRMIR